MNTPTSSGVSAEASFFGSAMLPCPFCGSKAWLRDNQACGWRVECDECQIGNLDYTDRETAISRWQNRTPRPSSDTEPSAWLAEGPGWKRVVLNREAAEKLCADFGQIFPLYLSARPSSDTIGGGELVLWLLSEAKRAEDFAPRYQAASPFRIVWEERAKKLRAAASAIASPPPGEPAQGVTEAAEDLLASLDSDALNPEQFNAWCALTSALAPGSASLAEDHDTMQPDVHDEGADFNGVVRPDRLSGGGDA